MFSLEPRSILRLSLLFLAAIQLVGIYVFLAYLWLVDSPPFLVASSPQTKFTVELSGDKGRGGLFIDSVVRYELSRGPEVLVTDRVAHRVDALELSFELAYPDHAWVQENVLRFWRKPTHPRDDQGTNELLILNHTNQTIKFLKINAKDMLFVLAIPPQGTVKTPFSHTSVGPWISCEGELEDGSAIRYDAHFPRVRAAPLKFCLAIKNDSVVIDSPHSQGYDVRGDWDNLNIGLSTTCTP